MIDARKFFIAWLALLFSLPVGAQAPVPQNVPYSPEPPPQDRSPQLLAPAGVEWGWQGEVNFALNSAKLRQADLPLLNKLAATLKSEPTVSVLLIGRTDNTGKLGYNQELSIKRATAVQNYLTQQGVDPDRIYRRAVGETRPVASNLCDEDRRRNRRVDIAFFPTGEQPPPPGSAILTETSPDRQLEKEACE